jgi:hypothetical protein
LPVCLDGRIVGGASPHTCKNIAMHLRRLKVTEPPTVPPTLEVALIPPGNPGPDSSSPPTTIPSHTWC